MKTRFILFLLCFLFLILPFTYGASNDRKERSGPSKAELRRTDKAVAKKVKQLLSVIESMQSELQAVNDGNDRQLDEILTETKQKYEKFSVTISKLGKQNSDLYKENKKLRQEKNMLVDKISVLEEHLIRQARATQNAGAEAWFRKTAEDLKTFLHDSGLEHFASPKFSPIVAGIVANGVVTVPLALTSIYLIRYMKHLSILRILFGFNLFDTGLACTIILSSLLLLGDPLEGMRHISEVNFIFIQLVVATVFWFSLILMMGGIVQHRTGKAWRYIGLQLGIKTGLAFDYGKRIWAPTMERNDVPLGMNVIAYVCYFLVTIMNVYLTGVATRVANAERRFNMTMTTSTSDHIDGDDQVMVTLVTQHTD